VDHGHGTHSYDVEISIGESLTIDGCVVSLLDLGREEVSLLVERIDDDDSWDSGFPEPLAASYAG